MAKKLVYITAIFIAMCAGAKAGVPTQSERWAILADSQFGDLLFAELSNAADIELVEREHFDEVLREQNITALYNPEMLVQRFELGKMLAADRLLTLRETDVQVEHRNLKRQRLAVFDTKSGTTIFDATLFDKTDPQEIAKTAAAIALDLNKNFTDGIRTAVAVPDFLSTDTTDETKPFMESFAQLVSVALLQQKDISVVSFEELQALQREAEIGQTDIQRIVPLLIRGQFKTNKVEDEFSFSVDVVLSDGAGNEETVSRESMSEKEIAAFLGTEIPKKVFDRLGQQDVVMLTQEKQEEEFSKIALRFRQYGVHDLALKYHQAIVLLNPNNPLERLRLLNVQRTVYGGRVPFPLVYPQLKYLFTNKMISFEMGADSHSLTRSIDPQTMGELTQHALDCELLPLIFQLPPAQTKAESGYQYLWNAPTNDPRYDVQWGEGTLYPPVVIRQLTWRRLLRTYINTAANQASETLLADTIPILTAYPENGIPNLTENERTHFRALILRNAIERDDARSKRFIEELRDSKQENLLFLADFLELYLDAEVRLRDIDAARIDDLTSRLAKLTHPNYEQHKGNEFFADYRYYYDLLDSYKNKAAKPQQAIIPVFANPLDLPDEPPIVVEAPFTLETIPEWTRLVEENFSLDPRERYNVKLEPHDATIDILWNARAICTIKRGAEGNIETQKIYESPEDSRILSVKSDGKYLWLSTLEGILCLDIAGGETARIGPDDGLPEFTAPPPPNMGHTWMRRHAMFLSENIMRDVTAFADSKLYVLGVFPVAVGDTLVFGRYGERQLTWIGRVRLDERTRLPSFKLLLQANRVLPSEAAYNNLSVQTSDEDKDLACTLSTVTILEHPDQPQRREVLFGRYFGRRVEASPLLIDLETDTVTTLAARYPSLNEVRSSSAMESVAGNIASVNFGIIAVPAHINFQELIFSKHQVRDGNMTLTIGWLTVWQRTAPEEWKKIEVSLDPLFSKQKVFNQGHLLWREGGVLYSIGKPWLKLDFSEGSFQLEELVAETIPVPFRRLQDSSQGPAVGDSESVERFGAVSTSAVFGTWLGLVAPGDPAYSIRSETAFSVDWNKPMKKEFPTDARFVSHHVLEKHLAAADKIRSLGGFVGNNAQFETSRSKTIFGQEITWSREPQRTVVVLTPQWKGTPSDLKLLADLDRFNELYFFDRIVSREEAEALETLGPFDTIHFIRSSIADADLGLIPVRRHWTLYSHPDGRAFGDETLESIFRRQEGNRRLISFVLVGDGFTERTAEMLFQHLPHQLRMIGTQIPAVKLAELKRMLTTPQSAVRFFDE